jgi:hypothetical protein
MPWWDSLSRRMSRYKALRWKCVGILLNSQEASMAGTERDGDTGKK